MNLLIIKFFNLFLSGLMAGTLFGIWIGYNPKHLSAETYVEQLQSSINALNTLMPVLGLITIILTLTAAFMQKQNQAVFLTLQIAVSFLIAGGLITKFGNQPINTIVMTWDKHHIPDTWEVLRDKWWYLHTIRMLTTVISFCLIISSNIRRI